MPNEGGDTVLIRSFLGHRQSQEFICNFSNDGLIFDVIAWGSFRKIFILLTVI